MAYSVKVGSFNIDTTKTLGQSQVIEGVGFQPKIVIFWWSGSSATGEEVAGGNINLGFGAATSDTARYSLVGFSLDGAATTYTSRAIYDDRCIFAYSTSATLDGIADFATMDADGFTLTIDDQFTIAFRINYLALGGSDLTNVKVGADVCEVAVESHDISGVGFKPEALLIGYVGRTTVGLSGEWQHISIGWATSSSAHGVLSGYGVNSAGTSNTKGFCGNEEIIAGGAVSIAQRETLVSFNDDGFTLNCLESAGAANIIFYIALKGGRYGVGDLVTRTDGNDIVETVGFQPSAIMFMSANRAESTQDTFTDHNRASIGAATSPTSRAVQAISDEDALVGGTEVAHANYDSAVYANIADDAIVGLMDLKSIESDGFTCVMDDTDPTACFVTYLAIGASDVYTEIAYGENATTQGETEVSWATWSDGAAGTPTITGDPDWGKLQLAVGEEGRSAVLDIGDANTRTYVLTENRYGTGAGTATLQIRGDTVSFLQDDDEIDGPTWADYTEPVTQTWRYVQVREIKSS